MGKKKKKSAISKREETKGQKVVMGIFIGIVILALAALIAFA